MRKATWNWAVDVKKYVSLSLENSASTNVRCMYTVCVWWLDVHSEKMCHNSASVVGGLKSSSWQMLWSIFAIHREWWGQHTFLRAQCCLIRVDRCNKKSCQVVVTACDDIRFVRCLDLPKAVKWLRKSSSLLNYGGVKKPKKFINLLYLVNYCVALLLGAFIRCRRQLREIFWQVCKWLSIVIWGSSPIHGRLDRATRKVY